MSREEDRTELLTRKIVDFLNIVLSSEHTQDFEYAFRTEKMWLGTEVGWHFFGLAEDGVKQYKELTDDAVRKKPWNRLSQKYVQNQLNELYRKALSNIVRAAGSSILPLSLNPADVDDVREQVNALVAEFDRQASEVWTIYLPISGIARISGKSLKIGKACLRYMTDADIGALIDEVEAIFLAKRPEDVNGYLEVWRNGIRRLKGTVCATYRISGESDKALESAKEQVQNVLDLLTYFLSFKHSRDYKGAIRLQGEMAQSLRTTFLVSSVTKTCQLASEVTGAYMPVEFTREDIKNMKMLGIFDLSQIIEKGQASPFQNTVLSGIRWFAASERQDTPEIEFVNLVTCLENCLTPGDSPIKASIAEGCAILLKNELEDRLQLRETISKIYGTRSKILHSGGSIASEFEQAQLADLRLIAQNLLAVLIGRIDEFKDKKDLLDWIMKQKLTSR
ncbi:MAG: hypothetical protein WAL97_05140 [Halobacteriota archaeon]